MRYGTYIFFRLGVTVEHVSQVFHFSHLSSLTEMRYWEGIFLSGLRGPVHLGLFPWVGVGARIDFYKMPLVTFFAKSPPRVVELFLLCTLVPL